MKTIIKLAIFTALAVMPFMTMAQENKSVKQDTTVQKETPVYRDTCVTWYRHLIGKDIRESNIECDSIRWVYNDYYIDKMFRVYVVLRGDHLGEYWHTISNDTLRKAEYYDGLHDYTKRVLAGDSDEARAARMGSYFNRVTKPKEPIRQKTVQEAFWEAKLKEDMHKSINKSK